MHGHNTTIGSLSNGLSTSGCLSLELVSSNYLQPNDQLTLISVLTLLFSYRVGVPGFLTSAELQNVGYKANNGIRDQRTSLMWVQKFISGFGGDPTKVTLTGQSAGAGRCKRTEYLAVTS